jgi:hypothetical protein
MPLTALQKSQVRRHLKYPNIGFSAASAQGGGGTLGTNQSWLATADYGLLELKMNSLQPCDEATLIGKAFGSINLLGLLPNEGDTVTLTFANLPGALGPLSSSPYVLEVTCGAAEAGSLNLFGLQIALAISQDTTLAPAGFQALTPYGPGSDVLNSMVEIGITNDQTFNLIAATTGTFSAGVMDNGNVMPDPTVQVGKTAGVPIIVNGYLPLLNYLYSAIATATTRQGVLQADVFKARQDEVPARKGLYKFYQSELANFLDVPINVLAKGGQQQYGQIVI